MTEIANQSNNCSNNKMCIVFTGAEPSLQAARKSLSAVSLFPT